MKSTHHLAGFLFISTISFLVLVAFPMMSLLGFLPQIVRFVAGHRIAWIGLVIVLVIAGFFYGALWPVIDRTYRRRLIRARLLAPSMVFVFLGFFVHWMFRSRGLFPGFSFEQHLSLVATLISPALAYSLFVRWACAWARWRGRTDVPNLQWSRRMKLLVVFVIALIIADFFLSRRPCSLMTQLMTDIIQRRDVSEAELRSVAYECARSNRDPRRNGGAYTLIARDESSVPVLLDGLWWLPRDGPRCGCDASILGTLNVITNQDAGGSYEAWLLWHANNRHKSKRQWILDGFRKVGLELSDRGSENDTRLLLEHLGQREDPSLELLYNQSTERTLINAYQYLREQGGDDVFDSILVQGSVQEKRGAAVYAQRGCYGSPFGLCLRNAELDIDVLEHLASDVDPTVRLWAKRGLNLAELRTRQTSGACLGGEHVFNARTGDIERQSQRAGMDLERDGSVVWNRQGFRRELPVEGAVLGIGVSDRVVALVVGEELKNLHLCGPVRIEGYSRSTGNRIWQRDLGMGRFDSPAGLVQRGSVLFVVAAERISAISIETGEVLWQNALFGEVELFEDGLAFRPEHGESVLLHPMTGIILPESVCPDP